MFYRPDSSSSLSVNRVLQLAVAGWIVALLSIVLAIAPAFAGNDVATGVIDYQRVLPSLQSSPVPLRLPKVVVYRNNLVGSGRLFAVGGVTRDLDGAVDGYNVNIVDSPNCKGALSCSIAFASATRIDGSTGSITDTYSWLQDASVMQAYVSKSPDPYGFVSLRDNWQVFVVPWVDGGGGTGYEQAVWDEGGYRYMIALKKGHRDWLLQMVNTAFAQ